MILELRQLRLPPDQHGGDSPQRHPAILPAQDRHEQVQPMKRTRKEWLVSGAPRARQASVPVVVVRGDLDVGAGLPGGPVGGDVAGGADELGEVLVEQLLAAGLGGVDRDVHGGADGARAIADRDRDGTDTGRELLVRDGPAARPDAGELFVEGLAGLADVARQPRPRRDQKGRVQLLGRQRSEQHLALGRLRRGEERADVDAEGDDLRHRHPRDVHDVGPVELRHRGRLTVWLTSASRCGRAMSHNPKDAT